ncbi:hypothetical protein BT63DRAFT_447490 [Microthyrium microscopicum]|uniref:ABC transporter domain-containing protein n=1 Tax=Microthyrium microscopicum TaxID=703497 RepID=A0A6A6U685_9PEZI|nr:hypothetical protein BT63DRAFT_447490 [Microthyrium microscopicum]
MADRSAEPTPSMDHVPGAWPGTPSMNSRNPSEISTRSMATIRPTANPTADQNAINPSTENARPAAAGTVTRTKTDSTPHALDIPPQVVASPPHPVAAPVPARPIAGDMTHSGIHEKTPPDQEAVEDPASIAEDSPSPQFAPIKTGPSRTTDTNEKHTGDNNETRPTEERQITEDDLIRTLSRRRTNGSFSRKKTNASFGRAQTEEEKGEQAEIERLLSRMFGRTRQANSEEEKTRHVGVVWKNLTVKGMGLGAALQASTGDIFMGLPRLIGGLFKGKKGIKSKPPVRTIIDDFSGSILPGEMCLVLGRPGSGCSTFLKVIGNQRFGYEAVDGEVTYGGTSAAEMGKKFRGEVLYNPEDDLHYATLKVKHTLRFALQTKAPGKDSRNEGESKGQYIKEFMRVVSKLFWIEHTMDTLVGNEFVRGVSGGEKKRVSIAEAMITRASTQCWDNSTRGLDASTALEYVSSIRSLTNMTHISTAVALYQAGESLYELFDKVLLIDEGKCCYFGPADRAADYFKGLGFIQPDRWTTADFLTSTTDPHERHIKEGWEDRIPRSAAQFADIFAKSDIAKENVEEIEEFQTHAAEQLRQREASTGKATKTKNYAISFPAQVIACTKRQWLVMLGDRQSLIGKWAGIGFQALIVGSLFYNLPKTVEGAFTRGGVMFFMLLFNALLALAELNAAFESRPILMKHKSFSFYRPAAYAIAQTVIDVPLVFVQNTIFNLVVYFMANLQRTPSQFFISLLIIFSITMTMYAFFRCVGATFGSLDAATRVTGVALQVLIVYTGYLIPPRKMHPWFSWLRWCNPVQYAFEAVMSNEFYNLEMQCVTPYLVPSIPGANVANQGCAIQGSTPGSATVSGANYISVAYGYSRSHLWRNFGIIWAFFALFFAITIIGMELQKPNKGGGAVTIYKRGQAPSSVTKAIESSERPDDLEDGTKEKDFGTNGDSSQEENEDQVKEIAGNEAIFTFHDVNYKIPYKGGQRQLLQNVQGFVQPGKLTALMGASGAGKTTLLNTLAQRIRMGVVTGDFLVDGKPLPKSFQRSSGFAEQMDIHEPTATVREAMQFSAKLRQPKSTPLAEKYEYVEKIIDLLEMREIAGAVIGEPGNGLGQEQRKRLTIGVELASKPELLMFLDEPTSGLDSAAAFNILRFLRKLANAGQALLVTIHQPSSVLFENFDRLLLLKSGGRTVYFGDLGQDSRQLLDYLESNGAKKCPPKVNPAEYMLEAIGAGDPNYNGPDWGDIWEKSEENSALTKQIQSIISDRREKSNVTSDSNKKTLNSTYAMPLLTQIFTVSHRSFVAMWRNQDYVLGMFILHIMTGLFNSFTFWHLGNSQIDMQSRIFSVFMTLTISPPLIQQLQPRFLNARNIYESREANSKIYSWVAFVTGTIVSEIPYRIVAGTIYWCCWYWAIWFPRDTYTSASMWLMVISFELFYLGFGQFIAAFSPNELLASLLVPVFFTFIVSFCGVVVPYPALPTFWRSWMYWVTPFKWLLEAMLSLVVHNVPVQCETQELALFTPPSGQSCDTYAGPFAQQAGGYVQTQPGGMCGYCQFANGDQFAASFNIYYTNVWRDYGIFWAYIIIQFGLVFLFSWIYLQGGRKVLNVLKGTKRKEKKMRQQKEDGVDKS